MPPDYMRFLGLWDRMLGVREAGESTELQNSVQYRARDLLSELERVAMDADTVAQMTRTEFKEMLEAVVEATVEQKLLEILGDPDEGLEIRKTVRTRLLRQREAVAAGQHGKSFQDVVREFELG